LIQWLAAQARLDFLLSLSNPLSSGPTQSPAQIFTPDRSNEFAAHRRFRLYLSQRFADFGRRTLSEYGARKADCNENEISSSIYPLPHDTPTSGG
jgi:hypothetical protein